MARESHPIKATFGQLAPLDDWQFIGSASITLVIDAMTRDSKFIERLTLMVPTAATLTPNLTALVKGHHWWQIVSISGGTLYGKPKLQYAADVTSSTGWIMTAGDRIGHVPGGITVLTQRMGAGTPNGGLTALGTPYGATTNVLGGAAKDILGASNVATAGRAGIRASNKDTSKDILYLVQGAAVATPGTGITLNNSTGSIPPGGIEYFIDCKDFERCWVNSSDGTITPVWMAREV